MAKWSSRRWLGMAEREFAKYKKNKDPETLAEAGEKLYNAVSNHLRQTSKIKIKGYKTLKKAALGDPYVREFFRDAHYLHVFFYGGYTNDITEEEEIFKNVANKIKKVI